MLTVFITSNQSPLHVLFCQLHVHFFFLYNEKIMKVKVRATKFSDIVKCTERGRHIGGRGVIQVFKNLERCWFRR